MSIDEILARLDGPKTNSSGWQAHCPAHDDREASLSLAEGDDGRVLVHCHAGCPTEAVVKALGLDLHDLFPPKPTANGHTPAAKPHVVATYNYRDEHGTSLYESVRYAPKGFRQRRPDGTGGWHWSLDGTRRVPYRLPELLAADPAAMVYVVEGEKDADRLASLGLVATTNAMGAGKWRAEYSESLRGRHVVILPDNDDPGRKHAEGVAASLGGIAASIKVLPLPGLPPKGDVSDWLDAGGTVDDLDKLVREAPAESPADELAPADETDGSGNRPGRPLDNPYVMMPNGIYLLKATNDGPPVRVPLTNFTAKIVADLAEDDGVDIRRSFGIEATLHGRTLRFNVPAERFAAMNWPTEHLGPMAIVFAGFGKRDHARTAIQLFSENVAESRVYAHLGWRKIEERWVYLHAGGGIGSDGPVAGVEVSLTVPLGRYRLPDPPQGVDLTRAIRGSLRILDLAPLHITLPGLAAVYRAPLRICDFTLHLAGPTDAGKSALAALDQQHYGAEMDARNLPAGWESTANSLEGLAFLAKDALLVVDDFAPTGSMSDVQRLHRDADRLLRAQGNGTGRARMRSDATIKAPKPPRGLILSTGEDVPKGKSLRGRMLILELGPKDLDFTALTACQSDAAAGVYARTLAAYVQWLASRRDDLDATYRDDLAELRGLAARSELHRRTPEIVANLAIGWRCFLRFAEDVGALTQAEVDSLWRAGWVALGDAAKAQARHQDASEPTRRFIELLGSAISSGAAHLAGTDQDEPREPAAWGWRCVILGVGENERFEWRPQGRRVGWTDAEDVYLDLDAALAEVQTLGQKTGDGLAIGPRTLAKRLHERGMLATTEADRGTSTVRKMLGGKRRDVLHLRAETFSHTSPSLHVEITAQTAQTDEIPSEKRAGAAPSGQLQVPIGQLGFDELSTKNGVPTPEKEQLGSLGSYSQQERATCVEKVSAPENAGQNGQLSPESVTAHSARTAHDTDREEVDL